MTVEHNQSFDSHSVDASNFVKLGDMSLHSQVVYPISVEIMQLMLFLVRPFSIVFGGSKI